MPAAFNDLKRHRSPQGIVALLDPSRVVLQRHGNCPTTPFRSQPRPYRKGFNHGWARASCSPSRKTTTQKATPICLLDLQALPHYSAGMKKPKIQYTVRDVPGRLDARLRETAAEYGVSLNEASLTALKKGLGLAEAPALHHDLDALSGSWVHDADSEQALDEMRQIDEKMWP